MIRRQVQQPVWYCYAIPAQTSAETIASALEAAYAVHTLGVGEDMCVVEGRVSISRPESKNGITLWQPTGAPTLVSQTGEVRLNVPVAGSLTSLEERFQAFQQRLDQQAHGYGRPVLPPARHGVVAYRSSDDAPRWAVVPLTLCQPGQTNKPARFHAERTVVVAGMLRHACMQLAGNGLLADFNSPRHIADQVYEALSDSSLRQGLAHRARATILERYDLRLQLPRQLNLLGQLIESAKGAGR